jgi:hypothetical protein
MQSAKKVILIPPKKWSNNQFGGGNNINDNPISTLVSKVEPKQDKIKTKIYDKLHKFVKVILKLARKFGYDDDLKIKLRDGKYLEKSNIVDLLTYAMSVSKVLYGENEFIELLHSAGVSPDLIINDNVRSKLIHLQNKGKVPNDNINHMEVDITTEKRKIDRKRPRVNYGDSDEECDEETGAKKRKMTDELREDSDLNLGTPTKSIVTKSANNLKRKLDNKADRDHKRFRYDEIEDDQIDDSLWEIPKENE